MGILRATKYKTLLKLSAAIFALSVVLIGGVLTLGHASAATAPAPKLPLTWADSTHTSATDQNKNVYLKAGYSCWDTSNGVNTLLALPPQSSWINCHYNVKDSSSDVFVWETSGSPKYALIISPYMADGAGKIADPGTCTPDTSADSTCRANIWTINGKTLTGSSSSPNSPLLSNFVIGGAGLVTPTQNPSSNSSTTPSCETSGFTLAWITCPIIEGMANAVDGMYANFIQPLMITKPISLDTTCTGQTLSNGQVCNPTYRSWSGFRVYGDIFLVIALLVVVFGQSIGGGFIDAYAAKKILPRLLMAAVLINLSYYIVAFMVDITNVVGQGIQTLLTQPFVNANAFKISMNAGSQVAVLGGTGLGLTAAIAGTWAGAAAISTVGLPAVALFIWPLLQFLLLFVLLPAFVLFMSIMFTFILRQGLIIILLIFAPVAFALYCLPNTEKYFKKWWDLLFKTLLIYPIVAVLFSLGNILSVVLEDTSQANAFLNTFAQLMSFIGLLVPLFLIPFAFKMAGGLLGGFYGAVNGLGKRGEEAIKGNANNPNSLRNNVRKNARDTLVHARATTGSTMKSSRNVFKRKVGRALFTPDVVEQMGRINAERAQALEGTWRDTDDTFAKGSTIPLGALDERRANGQRYRAADPTGIAAGNIEEQWQTADGTWINKADIKAGHKKYSSDAQKQFNYKKMLEKTEQQPTENQNRVLEDFLVSANDAGWDAGTAKGRWAGIAIPAKHIRIDLRRAKIKGSPRNLAYAGTDHSSLLEEYANMTPGEQIKETPESFGAIRTAVYEITKPKPSDRTDKAQEDLEKNAAKAYKNLERFVKAPQMGYYDTEAPGAVPGSPQSTSSAAAAKNAEAARIALAEIQNNPELVTKLESTWAKLGGEISKQNGNI